MRVLQAQAGHTSRLSLAWLSSRTKQIEEERDPHLRGDLAG